MNFGIALPNIGPAAEPETIFGLADAVEEFGLGSVWTGDHLAFPKNPRLPYPYARGGPGFIDPSSKVLDPLTVMAAVIGRTKRIKVGVSVLILPYRHPLVTAKQLGSMQVLSGGRVILGVGVGWIPEEFEALDVDFRKRGAMTDEQMRYFRAVWEHDDAEFEGAHYHIKDMSLFPRPEQTIPQWVGGNTTFAMRRAARLGDGLNLIDATPEELTGQIERFKRICDEEGRDPATVTLSIRQSLRLTEKPLAADERRLPITGNVEQVIEELRSYKALGIEDVAIGIRPRGADLSRQLEVTEIIAKEIAPAVA